MVSPVIPSYSLLLLGQCGSMPYRTHFRASVPTVITPPTGSVADIVGFACTEVQGGIPGSDVDCGSRVVRLPCRGSERESYMKTLFRLISLSLILGGWSLAALAVHVVRTPGRIEIITKQSLDYRDTWADTRTWTMADVPKHTALVSRVLATGNADLLEHLSDAHQRGDIKEQLAAALQQSPATPADSGAPHTQVSAGPISFTLPF